MQLAQQVVNRKWNNTEIN